MGYYAYASGTLTVLDGEQGLKALRGVPECPDGNSVKEILEDIGFHWDEEYIYFDVKLRDQARFLEALAPFADFEIEWRGEDEHLWRTRSVNGEYRYDEGQIIYADDLPY